MKMEDALSFYGTKSALATALGVSKSAITLWGDQVPPMRSCQLEKLTNGQLKADKEDAYPKRRIRRKKE